MEEYDLIIIGAGGSGLAAGMYAGRLGLKTLILGYTHGSEFAIGGVITTTNLVENYPGFKRITGEELAKNLEEHTRDYDLVSIKQEKAEKAEKIDNLFEVKTKKSVYSSKAIIFATGTKWKKLDVPGSKEFEGKGINYCALCDSPFYKNKVVAVVGGSDSAAKDALVLAEHAKKVYIIARGENIRPEPINYERIMDNKKIELILKTNVKEIKGSEVVNSIILDNPYKNSNELKLDGIFVAIGHEILSELAKNLGVNTNEKNEIIINHKDSSTNIKGVFAAGDVTDKPFKQLITGVAEGCTAAHSAFEYIKKSKFQ